MAKVLPDACCRRGDLANGWRLPGAVGDAIMSGCDAYHEFARGWTGRVVPRVQRVCPVG